MRLLILGGTQFLGRQTVRMALARGWPVTTFNRGQAGEDLPGVEALRGDRYKESDLAALARRGPWDAVVDTSGYVPRNVRRVAEILHGQATWYCYVSTVSVYADWPRLPLSERSPVLEAPSDAGPDYGDDVEDGPTKYGYQKAGCENAVQEVFGLSSSVLRPGVILGPGEYVGRLPWWLNKISQGGDIVAPGNPGRHIQPIDVRDVAGFICHCIENRDNGNFNVVGPRRRDTFGDLIESCKEATGSNPRVHWVSDDVLVRFGVRQWSELPLWRVYDGVWAVDPTLAEDSGLSPRELRDTVLDTWTWLKDSVTEKSARAQELGIAQDKEMRILESIS